MPQARKRHRNKVKGADLSQALAPNDPRCVDFKGEFELGDGRYCYFLMVTHQASRYVLACDAFSSTKELPGIEAFRQLFAERGLPSAIRSDNGVPERPLQSVEAIRLVAETGHRHRKRAKPRHPQHNGRHERIHLTLKKEATRPAGMNMLQQQARFALIVSEFNAERPHETLNMRTPQYIDSASTRAFNGLPQVDYLFLDRDVLVTSYWRICIARRSTSRPLWQARSSA